MIHPTDVNYWGIGSLGIFFGVILLVGLLASLKKKKERDGRVISEDEDHMLAGRSLGLGIGILSMTSTWIDGGYINGTAETVFTKGVVWVQGPIGYSLALVFGGLVFAKKMREKKFVTLIDPFQEKYGNIIGALIYIPTFMTDTIYIASIFSSLGASVTVMVGIHPIYAVVASGTIAVLYTLAGGMYSVSYTDVISIISITVGLCMAIPFSLHNKATRPLSFTTSEWLGQVDDRHLGSFIDTYIMLLVGGCSFQAYYQRVLSCPTARQAQIMSYVASIFCIALAIPPTVIGIIAKATVWNETSYGASVSTEDASMILPMVFVYMTPTWVSFVGLGIISAAVMSASDATILGTGSMFARNVYKKVLRPQASESEVMWVVRIGMVVAGIISVTISLNTSSISGLWYLCGDFAFVFLFPQMLGIVCFEPYCNSYGALISSFSSFGLRLLAGEPSINLPATIKLPFYDEVAKEQLFPFKTSISLIAFGLLIGMSCLFETVFKMGWLPMKYDVLKCFSVQPPNSNISQINLIEASYIPRTIPSMDNTVFKADGNI